MFVSWSNEFMNIVGIVNSLNFSVNFSQYQTIFLALFNANFHCQMLFIETEIRKNQKDNANKLNFNPFI